MFQSLLKKIARGLAKSHIPYMIIGGQAVLLYGEPRLTKDIDITLGVGANEFLKIVEIAKRLKLKILINEIEDFVKKTMVLPTIDQKSGLRVDFIFSNSEYEKQAIEKACIVVLDKTKVRFATLEDVVIHKVIAGRARDTEDVKSILIKNPKYNLTYIIRWLEKFDKSLGGGFCETFKKIMDEIK